MKYIILIVFVINVSELKSQSSLNMEDLFRSFKILNSVRTIKPKSNYSLDVLINMDANKAYNYNRGSISVVDYQSGIKYGMVTNLFPNAHQNQSFFLCQIDSSDKVYLFFIFGNDVKPAIDSNQILIYFLINDSIWGMIDYTHGHYLVNRAHIKIKNRVNDICINDAELQNFKMDSDISVEEFIDFFRKINYTNSSKAKWNVNINMSKIIYNKHRIYEKLNQYKPSKRDEKFTEKVMSID